MSACRIDGLLARDVLLDFRLCVRLELYLKRMLTGAGLKILRGTGEVGSRGGLKILRDGVPPNGPAPAST